VLQQGGVTDLFEEPALLEDLQGQIRFEGDGITSYPLLPRAAVGTGRESVVECEIEQVGSASNGARPLVAIPTDGHCHLRVHGLLHLLVFLLYNTCHVTS